MICELFPFQKQAVNEMRLRVAMALNNYRMLKIPQVVSLQAPTGSGKTIIMSALIEDIFCLGIRRKLSRELDVVIAMDKLTMW